MTTPAGSMVLHLPKARRRARLSLAPLIDVTFILLIFFMLVSQFSRLAPVDIATSNAAAVPKVEQTDADKGQKHKAVLQLHANGAFMVNGKHYDAHIGLEGVTSLLEAYFEENGANPDGPARPPYLVLLTPDAGVSLQQLIDALVALKRAPAFAVNIVVPSDDQE